MENLEHLKEIFQNVANAITDIFQRIKEILRNFIHRLYILGRPILYKIYCAYTGDKKISYLAIYHKNHLVRKRNRKRVFRLIRSCCVNG